MQRPLALWFGAACLAGVFSSACGSSASLGSQLTPSGSVTLTALSISLNTPSVGGGVQATATATFSNGTTSPIASGFGTDAPGVATVSSTGGVTGVAVGDVTIFVDYQGMRASKKVHVLPSYTGTFVGTYIVNTCVATGGFSSTDPAADFCTGFTAGRVLQIAIQNTQPSDLTSVTGLFALGQAQGSGTGTVSSTGTLAYAGTFTSGTTRMDFRNFSVTSPSPGKIAGAFDMVWVDSTVTGSGTVTCTNVDMTRQSLTLAPVALPLAVRTSRPAPLSSLVFSDIR